MQQQMQTLHPHTTPFNNLTIHLQTPYSMASILFPRCTLPFLLMYMLLPGNVGFMSDQDYDYPTTAHAEMAECGPRLLPLATCAPFVQGSIPAPTEACCNNLVDLYDEQPTCLCMLLSVNESTVTPLPLNRTLALQMPGLCNLSPNISDCPGLVLIPGSPESHVFNSTNTNTSSVTVSPPPTTPKEDAQTPKMDAGERLEKSSSINLNRGKILYTHTILVTLLMRFNRRLH